MSDIREVVEREKAIEQLEPMPPHLKPKRKYRRRVAPAKYEARMAVKPADSEDNLFFGYRPFKQCPNACVEAAATGKPCCWVTQEDRCVLSGLQSTDQTNPQNLARYNRLQIWAAIKKAGG